MIMIEVTVRGVDLCAPDVEHLVHAMEQRGAQGVAMTYDSVDRELLVRCHDDSLAMVLVVNTVLRRYMREHPAIGEHPVFVYQVTLPA